MFIIQTHVLVLDLEFIFAPDPLLYQLSLDVVYPVNQPHHCFLHHDVSQGTALVKEEQLVVSSELDALLLDHLSLFGRLEHDVHLVGAQSDECVGVQVLFELL